MTTVELEIELTDEPYEQMYLDLVEETETPVTRIIEQNVDATIEDLLHQLYQEAKTVE